MTKTEQQVWDIVKHLTEEFDTTLAGVPPRTVKCIVQEVLDMAALTEPDLAGQVDALTNTVTDIKKRLGQIESHQPMVERGNTATKLNEWCARLSSDIRDLTARHDALAGRVHRIEREMGPEFFDGSLHPTVWDLRAEFDALFIAENLAHIQEATARHGAAIAELRKQMDNHAHFAYDIMDGCSRTGGPFFYDPVQPAPRDDDETDFEPTAMEIADAEAAFTVTGTISELIDELARDDAAHVWAAYRDPEGEALARQAMIDDAAQGGEEKWDVLAECLRETIWPSIPGFRSWESVNDTQKSEWVARARSFHAKAIDLGLVTAPEGEALARQAMIDDAAQDDEISEDLKRKVNIDASMEQWIRRGMWIALGSAVERDATSIHRGEKLDWELIGKIAVVKAIDLGLVTAPEKGRKPVVTEEMVDAALSARDSHSVVFEGRREVFRAALEAAFRLVTAPCDDAAQDEARFNSIKDRLIAATGSPGLTSFHDGKVHMRLGEWDRLVTAITAPEGEDVRRLVEAASAVEQRLRLANGGLLAGDVRWGELTSALRPFLTPTADAEGDE